MGFMFLIIIYSEILCTRVFVLLNIALASLKCQIFDWNYKDVLIKQSISHLFIQDCDLSSDFIW